ncbi:hypothetical protein L838_2309 [Mycobacterium avium MAV_120709_2344]|nr:hypothetical protein L838_2309 [Mycobacterium avium MAV_120709_2344]
MLRTGDLVFSDRPVGQKSPGFGLNVVRRDMGHRTVALRVDEVADYPRNGLPV